MKILHVISNLGNGGAESMLYKIIVNSQNQLEHEVVSLTSGGKYFYLLKDKNIKISCLNFKKNKFNLMQIYKLFKIIKNRDNFILNSWMTHSNFILTLINFFFNKKIYWNIRNSTPPYKDSIVNRSLFKINKYLSFYPNNIIYNSSKGKEYYEGLGYSKKKSIIISNGFDPNIYFINEELRLNFRKNFLSHNDFIVGMIARYDPQKNFELLFNIISILYKHQPKNNIKFILAGPNVNYHNTDIMNNIKNYVRDKIILLDEIDNTNEFYNAVDVSILLSKYGEGFPNVLGESMLSGTPCITSDIGDTVKIISKFGWSLNDAKADDYIEIISKVKNIYDNDKEKWLRFGKDCRMHILENYNIHDIIKQFMKVWQSD